MARNLPLASSASTPGSRSPLIKAVSIARPDTPNTSVATESSLMPASSRVFWTRWPSEAWAWNRPLAIAGQIPQLPDRGRGTKLPRSSPCSNSSASQAASQTSVLRPGRILTWRALTNNSSKPASSRTYQTGFQYWPVASITTWVTPSAVSQSASASSPEVKVG